MTIPAEYHYLSDDGQWKGPFSRDQLLQMAREGVVQNTTSIAIAGEETARTSMDLPFLAAVFNSRSVRTVPPPLPTDAAAAGPAPARRRSRHGLDIHFFLSSARASWKLPLLVAVLNLLINVAMVTYKLPGTMGVVQLLATFLLLAVAMVCSFIGFYGAYRFGDERLTRHSASGLAVCLLMLTLALVALWASWPRESKVQTEQQAPAPTAGVTEEARRETVQQQGEETVRRHGGWFGRHEGEHGFLAVLTMPAHSAPFQEALLPEGRDRTLVCILGSLPASASPLTYEIATIRAVTADGKSHPCPSLLTILPENLPDRETVAGQVNSPVTIHPGEQNVARLAVLPQDVDLLQVTRFVFRVNGADLSVDGRFLTPDELARMQGR